MLPLIKLLRLRLGEFLTEIVKVATSKERLKKLWQVSLYSNAFYLMIAGATNAILGFVFWILAARFYSPEAVGLASATISAVGLLVMFCSLGLGMGLIRFLPHSGESASSMVNTVFTIGVLASIVAAAIFVAGLGFWSPALLFLRQNSIYLAAFVLFTIAYNITHFADQVFIAQRRARFLLAKNLIFSLLKLLLVILLAAFFQSFGIFASWGVSLGVALLVSLFLFLPRAQPGYRPFFAIDRRAINDMLRFSFANYLAVFLWGAPVYVIPIMVVNLLGAEANAYFYIAWAVASVLTMIASATATSLFAEGSHDEERLGLNTWRTLKMTYLILVPAVILILAIAPQLLLLFGGSYSENATTLLRILAISALPLVTNYIYLETKRVKKKLKIVIGLSAFAGAATLGLTYLLLPLMGVNGAGIAWLSTQGIIALVIVANWLKQRQA